MKAIRDNDLAAESSGVNLWRTKLYTFVIAGAGCALVGAIVAIHLLRVQPAAAFNVNWTAYLIFITVIGGVGTIEGPIIGTIIYYVLRETTSKYGEWYFIVLGLLAIIVTVWSPARHLRLRGAEDQLLHLPAAAETADHLAMAETRRPSGPALQWSKAGRRPARGDHVLRSQCTGGRSRCLHTRAVHARPSGGHAH